jgi:hypothetical protein
MKRSSCFVLVSLGVALVAACGGGTSSNPAPDGGNDGAGSGSSSGGSGSSSGGSGSSSSSGSGSSGGADGGSILPPGSTPGTGMVPCGATPCTAPQVCCAGGGGGAALTCSTLAVCTNTAGNDVYTCTSKANCTAPAMCCVTFGARGAPDVAACQASCSGGAAQVCQMDAECPTGQVCRGGGGTAAGITTCQPPLIPPGATQGSGIIACGGASCAAPQVCCSMGGANGLSCSALSACDNNGNDSYTCTGQANCTAPAVCCVTFGTGGANDVAVCQSSCGAGGTAQICLTNAECSGGLVCRGGGGVPAGLLSCRMPLADAGTPMDGAPAVDSAPPPDTGASDTGTPPSDAPSGS